MQLYESVDELIAELEAVAGYTDEQAKGPGLTERQIANKRGFAAAYRLIAITLRDTFIGSDARSAKQLSSLQ